MKVTLITTVSANGQVLLATNPKHQAPQEIMGFFFEKAEAASNIVFGRSTYNLYKDVLKDFLSNIEVVILSHNTENLDNRKIVSSPEEAIQYLRTKGFEEVIIGGGTQTYNAFLDADLVTDMYLSIVPLVVGGGGALGSKVDLFVEFNRMICEPVMDNVIRLHLSK